MPYGRGPSWVPYTRAAGGWSAPWAPRRVLHAPAPMERFMRRVRAELDMSAAIELNTEGAGFVTLAPDGGSIWQIRHCQVGTASGPADASQAYFYRSGVFPHRAIGQTAQGGGDTLSFDVLLRPGDTLICMWQGGNPGDVATLNINGIATVLTAA